MSASAIEKFYSDLRYTKGKKINYKKIFPEFFDQNNPRTRILFVSPRMDETGLYTHIIPALFLTKYGKYATSCITNIEKSKQELDSTISGYEIPTDLVSRSQIIVLPFLHQSLLDVYRALRGTNPDCRIVYTVDYNFYAVPRGHDKYETFKDPEVIKNIEMNMIYADKVIIPSANFGEVMLQNIPKKHPELPKDIYVEFLDTYLTPKVVEGINFNQPAEITKPFGIKRLGVVTRWHNKKSIEEYRKLFSYIFKEYKDKIELVFWGIDPFDPYPGKTRFAETGKLQEVIPGNRTNYRVFRKDSYIYHYKDYFNLNLDGILYLEKPTDLEKYRKEPQILFDATFFDQVIISNRHSTVFSPEEHYLYGSNVDELKQRIDDFYNNDALVEQFSSAAKELIVKTRQFNGDLIEGAYLEFQG